MARKSRAWGVIVVNKKAKPVTKPAAKPTPVSTETEEGKGQWHGKQRNKK